MDERVGGHRDGVQAVHGRAGAAAETREAVEAVEAVEALIRRRGYRRRKKSAGPSPMPEPISHELAWPYPSEIIKRSRQVAREHSLAVPVAEHGGHAPDRAGPRPCRPVTPPPLRHTRLSARRHLLDPGHRPRRHHRRPLHSFADRARLAGCRAALDISGTPADEDSSVPATSTRSPGTWCGPWPTRGPPCVAGTGPLPLVRRSVARRHHGVGPCRPGADRAAAPGNRSSARGSCRSVPTRAGYGEGGASGVRGTAPSARVRRAAWKVP
ncbi:hypothetical protein STBA_32380 [Streptomyces sp. MP131-18]|nr:hypothetical protein STBA_32380 [Streptomyces sp. MP131-18]